MSNRIHNVIKVRDMSMMNNFFTDSNFNFAKIIPIKSDTERREKWGVKSGAEDTYKEGNCVHFDTRSCPPLPVIAALSSKLKDETIELFFEDTENFTPLIKMVWKNGVIIEQYYAEFDFDEDKYGELEPCTIDAKFAS